MMDLTVEIHGDAESLEECLNQFTIKEWLDGDNMYKCDGCNDYVKAWKRLTVHQAPNILTIALKRFQSGRFGKLNKRVTFPENLNLTPYMSGNDDGTDLYSLYAVVVHLDTSNASFFGHYVCYIKDFEGHWYRIDDCKVSNVEVDEVLSQGAYMLLYSRRSPRRKPFIRLTEPVKKKQFTLSDTYLSNTEAAGSCGVLASLPSNASLQSNISLRDTGHERESEIKFDASRGKGRESVESVTPAEINLMLDPKYSEDQYMADSDMSSLVAKDFEEVKSSKHSQVPVNSDIDGLHEPDRKSESVVAACDFSANGVHKVFKISDRKGPKACSHCTENGSIGNPKPTFSRGFLVGPTRERSVNGQFELESDVEDLESDADSSWLKSVSERSKNGSLPNDNISPGSLKKHYRESTLTLKSEPINCNGSAELAFGSEASCSSQGYDTSTNGSVCNQKNNCTSAAKKDVASELKTEYDDNGGTKYQPKGMLGACGEDEYRTIVKQNDSSTDFVKHEDSNVR